MVHVDRLLVIWSISICKGKRLMVNIEGFPVRTLIPGSGTAHLQQAPSRAQPGDPYSYSPGYRSSLVFHRLSGKGSKGVPPAL